MFRCFSFQMRGKAVYIYLFYGYELCFIDNPIFNGTKKHFQLELFIQSPTSILNISPIEYILSLSLKNTSSPDVCLTKEKKNSFKFTT